MPGAGTDDANSEKVVGQYEGTVDDGGVDNNDDREGGATATSAAASSGNNTTTTMSVSTIKAMARQQAGPPQFRSRPPVEWRAGIGNASAEEDSSSAFLPAAMTTTSTTSAGEGATSGNGYDCEGDDDRHAAVIATAELVDDEAIRREAALEATEAARQQILASAVPASRVSAVNDDDEMGRRRKRTHLLLIATIVIVVIVGVVVGVVVGLPPLSTGDDNDYCGGALPIVAGQMYEGSLEGTQLNIDGYTNTTTNVVETIDSYQRWYVYRPPAARSAAGRRDDAVLEFCFDPFSPWAQDAIVLQGDCENMFDVPSTTYSDVPPQNDDGTDWPCWRATFPTDASSQRQEYRFLFYGYNQTNSSFNFTLYEE